MYFCTVLETSDLYELIEARRKELNLSQAELGELVNGKPSTGFIQNIRRGSSPTTQTLEAICGALNLEFYIGPPRLSSEVPLDHMGQSIVATGTQNRSQSLGRVTRTNAEITQEFAVVDRFDLNLSAGPGSDGNNAPPLAPVAFRKDWLQSMLLAAKDCVVLGVRGDSMIPTLYDGDLVMVDRRPQPELSYANLYAIVDIDGDVRVKRVEVIDDGLLLQSDNQTYSTDARLGDDANRVRIIGKVVWSSHKHNVNPKLPPRTEKRRPKSKPFHHVWL